MKHFNKLQTLLNDLRDKLQRRQYHVRCLDCVWEVRNLEHARFARRRGQLHYNTAHHTKQIVYSIKNEPLAMYEMWHSRA